MMMTRSPFKEPAQSVANHLVRARRASLLSSETLDRSRVLDTLVNNLAGMAYRSKNDTQRTMIFVSQGCLDLVGHPPAALINNTAISWDDLTHLEDRVRVKVTINAAAHRGQRFSVQYRITLPTGDSKWVLERGISVPDENGLMVVEGFIEDVTAQHEMLEAQQQAELRYRHIFEHASEGIFQTTRDGRYLAANPALAKIYGYMSPEELMANLSDIDNCLYVLPGQRDAFHRHMEAQGQVLNFESEIYCRDGTCIWISENAHTVRDAQGNFLFYEGTVQDISERKLHQKQLEHQANHDRLTGLPNRILLADRIEQGIAHAARQGNLLALVFIDLDNFKFINDSLGHAAGDELLKEVALRLGSCLRASDTVARLGGDEFVLVINDHTQVSTVISQLERVLQVVSGPIVLSAREFHVGASLGVALYPDDGVDAQNLLKHADVAMYCAKDQGRNNFQFFTPELNRMADERLNLEAAMRAALECDEFEVFYQPKVDHRRRVVGVEALARWFHPKLGTIGPDRFIPIAEETGLIVPLTTAILRKAFAAAFRWNHQREVPLRMAVNLSPRLFLNHDIVTHVADLLREAGLAPSMVELEITETVFLGNGDRAVHILKALKALGVHLAMDDFGTGYSSLSYLHRFPLDIIKIDRSLVTGLEHDDDMAMIARAVISLAQSLRKTVVAEGVENQAQFDFLRYQGCHEFQGYLLSRPLPENAFTGLMAGGGVIHAAVKELAHPVAFVAASQSA
jgi:diguanylate cyclase (GGDEF)-like protein/PAS domain S-box-containing protein